MGLVLTFLSRPVQASACRKQLGEAVNAQPMPGGIGVP